MCMYVNNLCVRLLCVRLCVCTGVRNGWRRFFLLYECECHSSYRPLEGFSLKGPIGLHSSKTTHARVSLFSLLKCCWLLCTQSGTNDQDFRGYFSARPHSVSPLTWHLRLPQQNRLIYLYYGILDSQTTVEQFLLRICNNFSSPKAKI